MEYAIFLLLNLYCILIYDINGYHKNADLFYGILFVILTFLSGFQYCMGTDIILYMEDFENANWDTIVNYDILNIKRQLGWLLFVNIMRFTGDFVYLKLVHAVFLNVTVFLFIYKMTSQRSKFTAVLLYFIMVYFDWNYNILRQSMAISFFLVACLYYETSKKIYYIFTVLSILFHSSAIVLVLLFVFLRCKFDLKIFSWSILLSVLVVILFSSQGQTFWAYADFMMSDNDSMSMALDGYMNNQRYESKLSIFKYLTYAFSFISVIWFILLNKKYFEKRELVYKMVFVYLFFRALTLEFVFFGRFTMYFILFEIILIAEGIYTYSKLVDRRYRVIAFTLLLSLFILSSLPYYFSENAETGKAQLYQFYPYKSIFY